MSGLENMRKRLSYLGGIRQVDRMNEDKLRTLKRALLYSYQSGTAVMANGREFRCLINPDKIKNLYDNKFISIPFRDICLNRKPGEHKETTTEGVEEIGLKPGDVFTWKENSSDWLVYLQRLEETAYFRAEIRRCRYTVDVDGTEYKCYAAKTSNTEIDWRHQQEKLWNDIDYTLQMYITKDEKTDAFFHRFTIVKINGEPWEVQSVDNMSTEGILTLYLKEWYRNTIQEEKTKEDIEKEAATPMPPIEEPIEIDGPGDVYPYDIKTYTIKNAEGGKWSISNTKAEIIGQDDLSVKIKILTGRSGSFDLIYEIGNDKIIRKIIIKSL